MFINGGPGWYLLGILDLDLRNKRLFVMCTALNRKNISTFKGFNKVISCTISTTVWNEICFVNRTDTFVCTWCHVAETVHYEKRIIRSTLYINTNIICCSWNIFIACRKYHVSSELKHSSIYIFYKLQVSIYLHIYIIRIKFPVIT